MALGYAQRMDDGGYRIGIFRVAADGCKCRQLAQVSPLAIGTEYGGSGDGLSCPKSLVAPFLSIALTLGYLCDESQVTSPRELAVRRSLGAPGYGGRLKDEQMRPFSAIKVHPAVDKAEMDHALRPILSDEAFGMTLSRIQQPGRTVSREHELKVLRGYVKPHYGVEDADVGELTRLVLDAAGVEQEFKWLFSRAEQQVKSLKAKPVRVFVEAETFSTLVSALSDSFHGRPPSEAGRTVKSDHRFEVKRVPGNQRLKTSGAEVADALLRAPNVFPVFVTGILNPFGPTLNISVLISRDDGMIVHGVMTLNPFECETDTTHVVMPKQVSLLPGKVRLATKEGNPRMVAEGRSAEGLAGGMALGLQHLYPSGRDSAPFTVFHASRHIDPNLVRQYLAGALARIPGAYREFDNLLDDTRRLSPFDRFDLDQISKRPASERLLSAGEVEELALLINNPGQQVVEIRSLLLAWDGAISLNSSGRSRCVCSAEELLKVLVGLSLDMPAILDGVTS